MLTSHFRANDRWKPLIYIQGIRATLLRHLKSVNVCGNNLDGTSVDHIAKTILHMPQLEDLNLERNPAIQEKVLASVSMPSVITKLLKVLNLSRTNIVCGSRFVRSTLVF